MNAKADYLPEAPVTVYAWTDIALPLDSFKITFLQLNAVCVGERLQNTGAPRQNAFSVLLVSSS